MSDEEEVEKEEVAQEAPVEGTLPSAIDLLKEAVDDFKENLVPFLMAGLGYFVVIAILMVVSVAFPILGMLPGTLILNDPLLTMVGMFVGILVSLPVLVVIAILPGASFVRALWKFEVDKEPLKFGSCFAYMSDDRGALMGVAFITLVLECIGVVFLYFPAIIIQMLLIFALPAVAIHRLQAMDALKLSFNFVKANFVWILIIYVVSMIIGTVASILLYIPIVGWAAFAAVITFLIHYQVKAYRAAFGDGSAPRGFEAS